MQQKIGHYEIVSKLGRGGMGVVYKGHESSLNRFVAIKVLGEHLVEDPVFLSRFKREAQSAARLSHPNIVQIYFIGEDEGTHYFVMEYVEGKSIDGIIGEKGIIDNPLAAQIILQAANGLAAAHDEGIIHRDIKPANLMLDRRGNVKIADFGLALPTATDNKLTATGMLMGTPGYLAPEQCRGEQADHRTDIYALGVTWYEMLTGRAPFSAESPIMLIRQILDEDPPDVRMLNPEVGDEAKRILSKMIAKDRDERYQSAHELVEDLEELLSHQNVRVVTRGLGALVPVSSSVGSNAATEVISTESGSRNAPTVPELPASAPTAVTAPDLHPGAAATERAIPPVPPGPNREKPASRVLLVALVILFLGAVSAFAAWVALRPGRSAPSVTEASGGEVVSPGEIESGQALGDPAPSTVDSVPVSQAESVVEENTPDSTTALPSVPLTSREPVPETPPGGKVPPSNEERAQAAEPRKARRLEGVAIAVTGDPQLAPAVSSRMAERLSSTGLTVYDASVLPAIEGLVRRDAATREMIEGVRDAGMKHLLVVRIEPTGERQLKYMGRTDTAYSSRITVTAYDVETGRPVGDSESGTIEYTTLNADREADKIVRRLALAIARRLRDS